MARISASPLGYEEYRALGDLTQERVFDLLNEIHTDHFHGKTGDAGAIIQGALASILRFMLLGGNTDTAKAEFLGLVDILYPQVALHCEIAERGGNPDAEGRA